MQVQRINPDPMNRLFPEMPSRTPRVCNRCRRAIPAQGRCTCLPAKQWQGRNGYTGTGSTRRWRTLRAHKLHANPICEAAGCRRLATEVDHIINVGAGGQRWPHGATCRASVRLTTEPRHKPRQQQPDGPTNARSEPPQLPRVSVGVAPDRTPYPNPGVGASASQPPMRAANGFAAGSHLRSDRGRNSGGGFRMPRAQAPAALRLLGGRSEGRDSGGRPVFRCRRLRSGGSRRIRRRGCLVRRC